jgi:hypothetical protein
MTSRRVRPAFVGDERVGVSLVAVAEVVVGAVDAPGDAAVGAVTGVLRESGIASGWP